MTLPLGLFSSATLSAPLPKISKADSIRFPLNRELLDMPAVAPDSEDLNDNLNWVDETS